MKLGRRVRKRGETKIKEERDDVESVSATNAGIQNASERTKRLGPAFRKAQGRVSRLWNRKTQTNFTMATTVSCAPLASDDECCRSNNSNGDATHERLRTEPRQKSNKATMVRKRLLRPLHDLRKRSLAQPYSTLDPCDEGITSQVVPSHEQPDFMLQASMSATIGIANQCAPRRIYVPEVPTPEENESFSMMDAESTGGVHPSLAESSVAVDEAIQAWEPPKPKKRKNQKPKHGDDSVLIGLIITYDPTTEMLDMGTEPQCIKRTMLSELQKTEEYKGCLLGDRTVEEESSTEETPSISDILGFHLDSFALPKIDTSTEEPDCPFPSETLEDEEEIVFSFGANPAIDSFGAEDHGEEIEIVFYATEQLGEDESSSDEVSSKSSKYLDCRSDSSNGSALPLEWMLPEATQQLPFKLVDESFEANNDELPEYEWFLPDHMDVHTNNQHTPVALFSGGGFHKAKISETPSTMGETFSFENQNSLDGSEGNISGEVLSVGSLPSEAVQSLLEFCQPDTSTAEKRLSRATFWGNAFAD